MNPTSQQSGPPTNGNDVLPPPSHSAAPIPTLARPLSLQPSTQPVQAPSHANRDPPASRIRTQQIAGSRRRARRQPQVSPVAVGNGISDATWGYMADVDAIPILQQNIIALEKCPANYRNLWRTALAEVNQAGQSNDDRTRKGAEVTLALLPNMLLRAPSAAERLISTRQKMDTRFAKFFGGQFDLLVEDIHLSSTRTYEQEGLRIPRSHTLTPDLQEEKNITRASKLAREGHISRAVRSLDSAPPAQGTPETLRQLQDLHPMPSTPVQSAIPSSSPRNVYIPSDRALYSAIRNAPNKIRTGPTNWSYEMLKNAMTSDPSTDLSAFKEIIIKFCTGGFRQDTIHLFRLAWMFAFLKNDRGDKRPVAAGEVLRKVAGKAIAIDYRVPWKEAGGPFQYGLNTPDGVNMVILMVEDTLKQNINHGAMAVDGQNAFNAARRQAILDQLFRTFPQLAVFVETWYLDPSHYGSILMTILLQSFSAGKEFSRGA